MPARLARFVELERAVEIAVVGDRQRVHAQLFGPLDQPVDRAGSVEQAVVAVAMQMNKRRRRHDGSFRGRVLATVILPPWKRGCHDAGSSRHFVRYRPNEAAD